MLALEDNPQELLQWGHLDDLKARDFFYADVPLTPEGESSTDFSTPSPALSITDLLVESELEDEEPPMDFDHDLNTSFDDPEWVTDPSQIFHGADERDFHHPESTPVRYDSRRVGRISRQNRIQEHNPYPRPRQGASTSSAPHKPQQDRGNHETHLRAAVPQSSPTREDLASPSVFYAASPMALPPSAFHIPPKRVDADKYLRDLLAVPPDAPVNLWSLSEGDPIQRPVTSLIKLSMLAIHGSEKKRLTLQQIYRAIEARFTYYRETEGKQWQNSIRHSLSLRSAFVKVRRPAHEPGKGFYWQLDFTNGDGLKRPRKRRNLTSRKTGYSEALPDPVRPRRSKSHTDSSYDTSDSDFETALHSTLRDKSLHSSSTSSPQPTSVCSLSESVPHLSVALGSVVTAKAAVTNRVLRSRRRPRSSESSLSDDFIEMNPSHTGKVSTMKGGRARV